MADLTTFIGRRQEPTGPVETFSTDRPNETVEREIAPRTPRRSCSASTAARAARSASRQISPGRKNSLVYEIDGSDAAWAWDSRAARPGVDRPPRAAQRDPHPQPRPDERRRAGGGAPCRAVTSRASSTRSVPISGRSTPTWSPGDPPARPATRRSRTATTRCSSATPSRRARARAAGSRSTGPRRPVAARSTGGPDEARLPDRPVPGDAADGGGRLGGRARTSRSSRSPAGRSRRGRPAATPARAISTSRTCPTARRRRSSVRSRRRGCRSPASAYYPNPLHPDPEHRKARSSATSRR